MLNASVKQHRKTMDNPLPQLMRSLSQTITSFLTSTRRLSTRNNERHQNHGNIGT